MGGLLLRFPTAEPISELEIHDSSFAAKVHLTFPLRSQHRMDWAIVSVDMRLRISRFLHVNGPYKHY